MSFAVAADAYDRFMGVYARGLSAGLADLAGVAAGQRVLDVGCGPGALTRELVDRVGAAQVLAVDPSEPFVTAARDRLPGVRVELAGADRLPFATDEVDAALAQLVVHFMPDPVAGLREMARVTRRGGAIAVSVWDYAGERAPLSTYWAVARAVDPGTVDESGLAGAREGHLGELLCASGLTDVQQTELGTAVGYETFEQWWEPYTLGVGPAGAHLSGLGAAARDAVREGCRGLLGPSPFTVTGTAWAARGTVG